MAVLAVIILILVAVVAVLVIRQGGELVSLDLPGFNVDTTAAGVFGIGVASAVLALLAIALLVAGARRGNRRRKEVKQLRRDADRQPRSTTTTGSSAPTTERTRNDTTSYEGSGPGSSDGRRSMGTGHRDDEGGQQSSTPRS
ncbi:MAG: hypothetical protein H0U47_11685 [Nocardioidaceae bacterium]|nr:hypothetical protein [Nocardioidaceae bacterium]